MRDPSGNKELQNLADKKSLPIIILPLDVTKESSVKNAIKQVLEYTGKIDVLINNVGIATMGAVGELKFQNMNFEEQQKLEKEAQQNKDAKTKITTIALFTGLGLLALLALVFYRNNRKKQKANKVLESTLTNLKSTQSQLIQSEKMASLGELTSRIAMRYINLPHFIVI